MDCERKGKWIRGCKFEPRYDVSKADFSQFVSIKSDNPEFSECLRNKAYRGDVCVTCGKLVNNQRPE